MEFSIRPLHPIFAAEVEGITLSADLDGDVIAALDDAINTYSVLVFRDQMFDDDTLLAFGQRFGSMAPPRNHRAENRLKHGEIADISNLNTKGEVRGRDDNRRLDSLGNMLWHSDASFRPVAGALSMLYAHVVPPKGGNTEFTDLRAVYSELDDELKAEIDDLVCVHSIFHSRGLLGHTDYTAEERAALPNAEHPLVRTHPGSGRKTLYMGAHADHIAGWPLPEGRLLIRDLMERATQRKYVHAHEWQVGDLVVWDNRCTLHRGRPYDDATHKRDLRRVTTQDLAGAQSIFSSPG